MAWGLVALALIFTVTSAAGVTDLLALGSTVTISLAANGTTSGRLFVPGGAEDGSDLDVDLVGAWTLTGSTVTFNQTADTFIRDAQFTAGRNSLNTELRLCFAVVRRRPRGAQLRQPGPGRAPIPMHHRLGMVTFIRVRR